MLLTAEVPVDLVATLVEDEAAGALLGRVGLTLSALLEMKLRGDSNGYPMFWTIVSVGSQNIRLLKIQQRHQEEEYEYLQRCADIMCGLQTRIENSVLPRSAVDILISGYKAVVSFYGARRAELVAAKIEHDRIAEEVRVKELEAKREAMITRERNRATVVGNCVNMPEEALRSLPVGDASTIEADEGISPVRIMACSKKGGK